MKTKIFIDTNIWLRYIIGDQKEQFNACQKLFNLNEQGKLRLYSSTIVLMEVVYTLTSFYKVSREQIISDLKGILSSRNLTIIEKTNFSKALEIFETQNIKLTDCLIVSQLPKSVSLCTYDTDFKKIKNLPLTTPQALVA